MKPARNTHTGVVYSTKFGEGCPSCGNPANKCSCQALKQQTTNDGIVRVRRETKCRKGSGMTLIEGIPLDKQALKELAKKLKQICGSGGTVKSGTIEIQGDKRTLVFEELSKLGYTIKQS